MSCRVSPITKRFLDAFPGRAGRGIDTIAELIFELPEDAIPERFRAVIWGAIPACVKGGAGR